MEMNCHLGIHSRRPWIEGCVITATPYHDPWRQMEVLEETAYRLCRNDSCKEEERIFILRQVRRRNCLGIVASHEYFRCSSPTDIPSFRCMFIDSDTWPTFPSSWHASEQFATWLRALPEPSNKCFLWKIFSRQLVLSSPAYSARRWNSMET